MTVSEFGSANNYTAGAKSSRPARPWKLRASAQARMWRAPVGRDAAAVSRFLPN